MKFNINMILLAAVQASDLSKLQPKINEIIKKTFNSTVVYDRLAEMTDLYGHRITGSEALEKSIDWIKEEMVKDGLHFYTQNVKADLWVRNSESLIYHSPTRGDVSVDLLGLGRTVGTGKNGVSGEVISIKSWEEHEKLGKKGKLKNKIVLCNHDWTTYGAGSQVRQKCALRSEQYGALAVLVRSVAPFSIATPHTGTMSPSKIPAASITIGDAEMFHRIQTRANNIKETSSQIHKKRFKAPRVTLTLGATTKELGAKTRNLIAEIKGSHHPEEIILMSGHIDSWDVGVGAMDDGSGAFLGWEALRLIKVLKIKPKRTLRLVMFVNEESGGKGSLTYFQNELLAGTLNNHVIAIESDFGTFNPKGLGFSGTKQAFDIMTQIGTDLLNHTTYGSISEGGLAPDIAPLCLYGIPCGAVENHPPITPALNYFTFHHTKGDRMEVLKPAELARCVSMTASFMVAISELDQTLPKQLLTSIPKIAN